MSKLISDKEAAVLITQIEDAAKQLGDASYAAAKRGIKARIYVDLRYDREDGFYASYEVSVADTFKDLEHEPPEYWRDAVEEEAT